MNYDFIFSRQLRRRMDAALIALKRMKPSMAQAPSPPPKMPTFDEVVTVEQFQTALLKRMANGPKAPGPDRIALHQLGRGDALRLARDLVRLIRDDNFITSTARSVDIKKSSGGVRTLKIRSDAFAVAATALNQCLQPYFESVFLPRSFGFRAGLSTWHMLLSLEKEMLERNRWLLVQDDIAGAYDNINITLTVEDFARRTNDTRLLGLLNRMLRGHPAEQREIGLDQGSPLGPLALNVHLHHHLDVVLATASPQWRRFVDNAATVANCVSEGKDRLDELAQTLSQVGLHLKGEDTIRNLNEEAAQLLGHSLQREGDRLVYGLVEKQLVKLKGELAKTWEKEHPHQNATSVITGFIASLAPAFEKREAATQRQLTLRAAEVGHQEIPGELVRQVIRQSVDRWQNMRRSFDLRI